MHATECLPTCRIDRSRDPASRCRAPREGPLEAAFESIKPDAILQHIKVLASDEYEGREPGTPGEDRPSLT